MGDGKWVWMSTCVTENEPAYVRKKCSCGQIAPILVFWKLSVSRSHYRPLFAPHTLTKRPAMLRASQNGYIIPVLPPPGQRYHSLPQTALGDNYQLTEEERSLKNHVLPSLSMPNSIIVAISRMKMCSFGNSTHWGETWSLWAAHSPSPWASLAEVLETSWLPVPITEYSVSGVRWWFVRRGGLCVLPSAGGAWNDNVVSLNSRPKGQLPGASWATWSSLGNRFTIYWVRAKQGNTLASYAEPEFPVLYFLCAWEEKRMRSHTY